MNFLHLGWDVMMRAEGKTAPGAACERAAAAWEAVDAAVPRPEAGLAAVGRVLGWQALHVAAMAGNTALVRTLVANHGCSVNDRTASHWTPLQCAAAYNQVRNSN